MVNAQRQFLGKFQRAALTKFRTAAKSGSRPQGGVGRGPNRSRKGTGPRVPGPDGFSLESAPEHPRTRASKHPRTRTSTHPSMQKPVLTFPPKREVSTGAHKTREPRAPGTQGPGETRKPRAPDLLAVLQFLSCLRCNVEQVAHNTEVCDLEDGSLFVLVHSNDGLGGLHTCLVLDGTRDA